MRPIHGEIHTRHVPWNTTCVSSSKRLINFSKSALFSLKFGNSKFWFYILDFPQVQVWFRLDCGVGLVWNSLCWIYFTFGLSWKSVIWAENVKITNVWQKMIHCGWFIFTVYLAGSYFVSDDPLSGWSHQKCISPGRKKKRFQTDTSSLFSNWPRAQALQHHFGNPNKRINPILDFCFIQIRWGRVILIYILIIFYKL